MKFLPSRGRPRICRFEIAAPNAADSVFTVPRSAVTWTTSMRCPARSGMSRRIS